MPYGSSLITSLISYDNDFDDMDRSPSASPVEDSPCLSTSQDITAGIWILKDAATDIGWQHNPSNKLHEFSNTVRIGGITMNKSWAIAQQFQYITSASSTDRLRRIAQESRFKTNHLNPYISDTTHLEEPMLSIFQPITTLIFCEQKLFLCIGEINGLFHDTLPVDDIPVTLLSKKIIQVLYQALRLIPTSTTDDPNGINDWRSSTLFSLSAKVSGTLVQPINPTVASHIPCNSFFLFKTSTLIAIASNLRDRVIRRHRKAIPHVKASEGFSYQERHSKFFLLVTAIELIIYQGEHVLLSRSLIPTRPTWNISGWLV